ncbi:MAG: hypothetical protein M3N18_08545 [Actinomycetota bacterium]|nr:hypothetical protein [Actinomycetota bacterium]
MGEHSFDRLAKGLADGTITRVQALKLAGAAILGAMLGPLSFSSLASAQEECDSDEVLCGSECCDPEDCCGTECCGPAEECCDGVVCCGPTEECCFGVCCESGKVCDATSGLCVCSPELTPCGSECCDPVLEVCGEDGQCHNAFCESCRSEGGQCCQLVEGGVLISESCCYSGESVCMRAGAGCLCCPSGTRCPDEDLGEAFVCVSV